MNKFTPRLSGLALILVALTILASCVSNPLGDMTDEELISKGIEAWNTKNSDEARPYFSNIKNPASKEEYLAAYDKLAELEASVDAAELVPAGQEAKQSEAYANVVKQYQSFPKSLRLPGDLKERMLPITIDIVKVRVKALKHDSARDFIKRAKEFLGETDVYNPYIAEMDAYALIQKSEKGADQVLEGARAQEDFYDKIAQYEKAFSAYAGVEDQAGAEIKRLNLASDSTVSSLNTKIRKKKGDSKVEKERMLRERQYSFRERIGEEFARTPESSKIGNMSPADILKFNEEIRANINELQKELLVFGERYPTIIDKDMLKDVEEQRKSLDARITIIIAEIKTAKDIASRGKAALPLMIGLFNPQPGTKAEDKKSRPAILKGTMKEEADYWWGMVSIDPGTLNDLVVTMKDSREVQIFQENTLSGSLIKMKGLKNVINKSNKVGNSWPVLNAGAQLPKGHYYIQLGKGSKPEYNGDVVVYSSFIARMR